MQIIVNNEPREVAEGTSIERLAEEMALPKSGVAIAVGTSIIPRGNWGETTLGNGDNLTIIKAVCGG